MPRPGPAKITVTPDYKFEKRHVGPVAGVDEAGRGPWAGPVVAAAVILDPDNIPAGLADSKQLSAQQRAVLRPRIEASADVGIGLASVAEIDAVNILQATFLAMQRALAALSRQPVHALIDGNRLPPALNCAGEAIIKGDARSLSIAAASIIAKQYRDHLMCDLAAQYPGYGWERNAGYGTKQHQAALRELGVTPHHRRSYAPIRKLLNQHLTL